MIEILRNSQVELWNKQHFERNANGLEGTVLRDVPTETAVYFVSLLSPNSRILEIGSANGRDARSWAKQGHVVDCIDFSTVALSQLEDLAKEQGVINFINSHAHDVSDGSLPKTLPDNVVYDAFYSRSALTINNSSLNTLVNNINKKMRSEGVVLIEGRSLNDPKIKRSVIQDNMADDNGHLRRVYTAENMTTLAKKIDWKIKEITEHQESGFESIIHMLRFVATVPQRINL